MLDDLRSEADFIEDDAADFEYEEASAGVSTPDRSLILGMTPIQRFVIAVMILLMTCVLGSFFLLITETVWLPL